MLYTLLLGVIAGWGASFAEDRLRVQLARALSIEPDTLQPVEMRTFSLVICMLASALVAWAIADAHAVPLTLGAAIGVLFPRLRDRIRAAHTPDYDS